MFKRLHNEAGMSLIEIMIVMGIIATAATAIMTSVIGGSTKAKKEQTKTMITEIVGKAKLYKQNRSKYPSSLEDLVEEGLLAEVPKDAFGNDLHYESPGQHSKIDVWSDGPDEETEDDNINSWQKDEDKEE